MQSLRPDSYSTSCAALPALKTNIILSVCYDFALTLIFDIIHVTTDHVTANMYKKEPKGDYSAFHLIMKA